MHKETAINALRRGIPLAAEVASADPQRRAWIGIYPLDPSRESTREFLRNAGIHIVPSVGRAYRVRTFEIDRTLNAQDIWIGESELANKTSFFAFTEDDLIRQLESLGTSLESFEPHHKSDYPI
jgi:hypothetical protein